jgi:hypothetical protein
MIYLKRFLYILIIIILYTFTFFITLLYILLIPIGMIISFILTEDFTNCFIPFVNLEGYLTLITDKLESIFLK